jgi:arginase family enzyme
VQDVQWAHLDLDGAWPAHAAPGHRVDARVWGPRLRFCAPTAEMEGFAAACLDPLANARFFVYGSGDFHHLSALLVRRIRQPLTLVSFDNHPDWDIRPPRWCCGSWINRALDFAHVEQVAIWGCGNFECWGWHRLWGNRRDVRSGRLAVHPWADDRSAADQARPAAITRANWRERFAQFAAGLAGRAVYVTVDLDGLRAGEAVTNWENGRFAAADVCWALDEISRTARIVAGDVCGAYSPPAYARGFQRFASETDHPPLPALDEEEAGRINLRSLDAIRPHFAPQPGPDQERVASGAAS